MVKDTVKIHGKDYETVASRVKRFREDHKNGTILTDIISNDSEYVVMKALIYIDKETVATGHAQEKYGSSNINQTSALENCETSAIGRALACFGYLGTEFASADEVGTAIQQQASGVKYTPNSNKQASDKQKKFIGKLYVDAGGELDMLKEYITGEGFDPDSLSSADASQLIEKLQGEQ